MLFLVKLILFILLRDCSISSSDKILAEFEAVLESVVALKYFSRALAISVESVVLLRNVLTASI